MRDRIAIWWLLRRYQFSRWRDAFWRGVAYRLPRKVVYWATIRLMVHATTGPWSHQIVPELEPGEALTRWELAPRRGS